MKKVLLLALAIVCGVAFSDNFAKKPKKVVASESRQAALDSLRMEQEKEELELQRKLDSLKMAVMEAEMKRPRGPLPYDDMEEMPLPCQEEAQSSDEYFAALGISENEIEARYAIANATREAQFELLKLIEEEEANVDKMEQVCRQVFRSSDGTWNAYVALRYPKNNK